MRTLLLSIALIGLVGCGNVIVNNNANDGGSANENADGAGPSHQPPSEVSQADVIDVLTKWRDQIYPALSNKERQEIETFVAAFPLEAPAGTEPIIVESSLDEPPQLAPVINRRDWAYALRGAAHTLVGGFVEKQADLLDVAFWRFLEAALLYARSLEVTYASTRNNLAFTYEGQGDHGAAIVEQLVVVMLQPDASFYIEGLASYYDTADMDSEAQL